MASDPELTLGLNLYQSEHHFPLPDDSLRTNAIQILPEALSVTEPNRQPSGEGGRVDLAVPVAFPDLPLNSVLVEASLHAQLGSSPHT